MPSYTIYAPFRSTMRFEIEREKELNRSEVYASVTEEDLNIDIQEIEWGDVTYSWENCRDEDLAIFENGDVMDGVELERDDAKNIFRQTTEEHLQEVISENVLTDELRHFLESTSLITEDGEEKEFSTSDFDWEVSVNLKYVGG